MTEPSKSESIGIIGLGYVGLPLALAFASNGYKVVGVDIDKERIADLNSGISHVRDISNDELKDGLKYGFRATSEYSDLETVDGVLVCVPTPLGKSGEPDLSSVIDVTERLADVVSERCTVVLESTVYPGATKEIVADYFESVGFEVGEDIYVSFSPERIDPGNDQYHLSDIPKIVGGVTDSCGDHAEALYRDVFHEIVRVETSTDAEFVKILENTFRSVNIGLINELSIAANRLGVDIWDVIEAAETKPFGFMPFYPGPGLGGHCIPVDPQHLSWRAKQYGMETRFINLADRINRKMPRYVVNRVSTMLNQNGVPLLDSNILLLGVSYKPGVPDTRESPAFDIIDHLRSRGANVSYHDPYVPELVTDDWTYSSSEPSDSLLDAQDCVIIVTDHSEVDYEHVVNRAELVFDTRNTLDGYEYSHVEIL